MASISKGPDGHRIIQFIDRDRKRKSLRLGKVSQRLAESIKGKVEALSASQISRCPVDDDTARWVSQIGDDLAAKVAAGDCQETTETQKAPENGGLLQVLSTVCKSLQDKGLPLVGLEPTTR